MADRRFVTVDENYLFPAPIEARIKPVRSMLAGEDWDTITTTQVATQNNNITNYAVVHAPGAGRWSVHYDAFTTTSGQMLAYLWDSTRPRMYIRIRASGTWFGWFELGPDELLPKQVAQSADLNTVTRSTVKPTIHQVSSVPTDWVAQHYPAPVTGFMTDTPLNTGRSTQLFYEFGGLHRVWDRWQIGGTSFGEWVLISGKEVGKASTRHQLMQDDMEAHAGGVFGTGGATPVALTWDDYPADFRDKVLTLLADRSIPATLAAVADWYGAGQEWLGAAGTTWAEIDGWPVEVACHSMTHGNALNAEARKRELVDSAVTLRANLPSKRIQCFIQPSANYGAGFNNGDSLNAYADTEAGTLLLGNYGMVTGTRNPLGTYGVPRQGKPYQGLTRTWIDTPDGIVNTKTRISALAGTGQGIIVGAHASRLDGTGNPTTADLAAFLDWLILEQSAGRIMLVTLSQWAVADTRQPA